MRKITMRSPQILQILVLMSIGLLLVVSACTSAPRYDTFTQCLTDGGVKMYGAYWCPHCEEQKKMFGESVAKLDYVECSLPERKGQTQICIDAGIQSYPTWEFADGKRITGTLELGELGLIAGCDAIQDAAA